MNPPFDLGAVCLPCSVTQFEVFIGALVGRADGFLENINNLGALLQRKFDWRWR